MRDSYTKEIKELEDKAIEKYEANPEENKFIKPIEYIRCQKCGGKKCLMKVTYEGQDFWFCSECIKERARELQAKPNKIIGEM